MSRIEKLHYGFVYSDGFVADDVSPGYTREGFEEDPIISYHTWELANASFTRDNRSWMNLSVNGARLEELGQEWVATLLGSDQIDPDALKLLRKLQGSPEGIRSVEDSLID